MIGYAEVASLRVQRVSGLTIHLFEQYKMKLFKNLIASACALLALGTSLSAQDLGKIGYRAEAGLTLSRITSFGVNHDGDTGVMTKSFRVGASVILPFENTIFSFNPGLYVIGRGEGQNNVIEPEYKNVKIQNYALQLPLEVSLKVLTIGDDHRVFFNVAPYLAYGLSAKLTNDGKNVNAAQPEQGTSLDLYKEKAFNRFEVGLGASLMYQYKQFSLRGGVEGSLTKSVAKSLGAPYYVTDGTPRFLTGYITLGYQF